MFYLYILFSDSTDTFYIGQTNDPTKRLSQHLDKERKTFTNRANDWSIKAVFQVSNARADAIKIERFIKKQKNRTLLLKLIDPTFVPIGTLAILNRVPIEQFLTNQNLNH